MKSEFRSVALAAVLLAGTAAVALAQSGSSMGTGGSAGGAGAASSSTLGTGGSSAGKDQSSSTIGTGGSSAVTGPGGPANSARTSGEGGSKTETSPNRTSSESNVKTEGSASQASQSPNDKANGKAGGQAGASSSSASSASASATVNLTVQQKTEIRQTIINNNAGPRIANPNFKIGVGVTIPTSVELAALPGAIVSIQPAWRGYRYFVHGEEIVIIDPRTHRIVAVLAV